MSLKHGGNYLLGEQAELNEIPERVLEQVADRVIRKIDCPECGEEMFYTIVAGHNTSSSCNSCGAEFKVVG